MGTARKILQEALELAPLSPEQSAKIRRRNAEIDLGTAKLVDGDEVLRTARARIDARPLTKATSPA